MTQGSYIYGSITYRMQMKVSSYYFSKQCETIMVGQSAPTGPTPTHYR